MYRSKVVAVTQATHSWYRLNPAACFDSVLVCDHVAVVDFVTVKTPKSHRDQQASAWSQQANQSKALIFSQFQQASINDLICFGSRGSGVRISRSAGNNSPIPLIRTSDACNDPMPSSIQAAIEFPNPTHKYAAFNRRPRLPGVRLRPSPIPSSYPNSVRAGGWGSGYEKPGSESKLPSKGNHLRRRRARLSRKTPLHGSEHRSRDEYL